MTSDQAIAVVQDVIHQQLGLRSNYYDLTTKIEDLDLDSLDLVEITMLVEEQLNQFDIFPKDLSQFKTVSDLVNFVEKYEIQNTQE